MTLFDMGRQQRNWLGRGGYGAFAQIVDRLRFSREKQQQKKELLPLDRTTIIEISIVIICWGFLSSFD